MLQLIGRCLGTKREWIKPGTPDQFESVTFVIQSGEGIHTQVVEARVGRDFPGDQMPKDGEQVALNVVIGTYSGRNGAGYNLTALSRADAGRRVAAAS